MHEFSLMADLMRKIEQVATEQQASRVVKVSVWLGALAHISAEHFREHFVIGAANSIAGGATLEVEESDDIEHPQAQEILLRSIEVE